MLLLAELEGIDASVPLSDTAHPETVAHLDAESQVKLHVFRGGDVGPVGPVVDRILEYCDS